MGLSPNLSEVRRNVEAMTMTQGQSRRARKMVNRGSGRCTSCRARGGIVRQDGSVECRTCGVVAPLAGWLPEKDVHWIMAPRDTTGRMVR